MVNPISANGPSIQKREAPVTAPMTSSIRSLQEQPSTHSAQPAQAAPAASQQSSQAKPAAKPDVVDLSFSAQAQLLRQKGMSIAQIALQLGLDVTTVTSFFPQSGSGLGTA
jgi:hypothetical protein